MSRVERDVASSVASQLRNRARRAEWAQDPVQWAHDVLGVHLWSKQREISDSVVHNKRTVVASCHGTGKALAVDTPIPVPGGTFVDMGSIEPGMEVLGSSGQPVKVIASTGIHPALRYRLTLEGPEGGRTVTASGDHLWAVLSPRNAAMAQVLCTRAGVPLHTGMWHHRSETVRTEDIFRKLREWGDLAIPAATPVLDPRGPQWTPDADMLRKILESGGVDSSGRAGLVSRVPGSDTHPPMGFMRARAWLSQRGVHTLLRRQRIKGGTVWSLAIAGTAVVDMLPSGDDRAIASSHLHGQGHPGWRIKSIESIGPGPVQCIQVDSPDHLYLCTEDFIPTHNSMIASVLACWWVSTRPVGEAIVVSTAPSYPQVNKILWEEIRKHHASSQRKEYPMIGRVTQGDEWKSDDGQILAFGRKPPKGDQHAFQGIHRRYVLVIVDEACGIPSEIWTGAEAITTNEGCRILAIGNPDDRNTQFGNVYLKPELAQDWHRIHVPASSTPNFTGEEVPSLLREVLVSKPWCEERRRDWGEKDPRYTSKVEANFPEESKSSLFSPAVVAASFEDVPVQPVGPVLRLGVDVARFGGDQNVVVSYVGSTARVEETWTGTDTVSSAYQVLEVAERIRGRLRSAWVEIRVDAVGLGAGVVDTLNARAALLENPWFSVYEMHGSASPPVNTGGSVHGYGNARAYWFDQLRQSMRNGRVRIEESANLRDDLAMIFYQFKQGKLFVLSKEVMRKEFGKSPDYADALVYATAPVEDELPAGSSVSQDAGEVADAIEDEMMGSELTIAPY